MAMTGKERIHRRFRTRQEKHTGIVFEKECCFVYELLINAFLN